jgi:localization factor PodJL
VEAARTEIAERLASVGSEQVEARLGQMADEVAAVEQRSARAIETMGREVLSMAETLNRRVQSAELRSAEAIEQVGGEIARIAGAVETRLGTTDQLHAEALERLGAEIGRITERLTDRIIQSERRAAQAIDDVGEQVAQVTERIEQRHERAASDLAERLRQSEERTARLLEQAGSRLDAGPIPSEPIAREPAMAPQPRPDEALAMPAPPEAALVEPEPAHVPTAETMDVEPEPIEAKVETRVEGQPAPALFGAELFSRAEPFSQPALDPGNPAFGEEDFAAVDAFAPIAEREADDDQDRLDFEAPPLRSADAPPLSTREVIEQARAAARAAAGPREKILRAPEPAPRRRLFGLLKPNRPASTWQTALMVAGGAAFLSVGAAGVVLMEGPGSPRQAEESQPLEATPRAALALAPDTSAPPAKPVIETPSPAPAADAAPPAAPDPEATDYIETVRAVEAGQAGALAHLKVLAEGGWSPAQVYLARLYETGQAGVVQNLAEARKWTARAAEAGDPPAMHNLALYYFRGEGGPQDATVAAQWFKKAAERGIVDSQYNLGLLYQSGSGVPRDLAQAYRWFTVAANAGDTEARAAATQLADKLSSVQLAAAEGQAGAAAPPSAAPPAAKPAGPPLSVAGAQRVLGRLGYYKGHPDGTASRQLKLAVAAYQRDQGLAATGSLDAATVSRLAVLSR